MVLSDIRKGGRAKIRKIESKRELYRRLASMGILEGSIVNVLSNKSRGPVLIEQSGKHIAIGRGMADQILVIEE